MLIGVILAGMFVLFLPFVFVAGREETKRDQKLAARLGLVSAPFNVGSRDDLYDHGALQREKEIGDDQSLVRRTVSSVLNLIKFDVLALRAGSKLSGLTFVYGCATLQAATGVLIWFISGKLIEAFLLGVAVGFIPIVLLRMQGGRRLKRMETVLPQVVEMIARALRAGHSLPAAFSIVAEQAPEPAREEFGELFRKQKLGFPLREALLELLERVPSQDLRVLVVGILVQRETGGNLTVILDRTSSVIRERLKLQGDVLVHTAQGRLTGWILCALPILLFALISVVNPSYTKGLTDDPLGRECLYGGVGLLLLGAFLISKIVSGIEV